MCSNSFIEVRLNLHKSSQGVIKANPITARIHEPSHSSNTITARIHLPGRPHIPHIHDNPLACTHVPPTPSLSRCFSLPLVRNRHGVVWGHASGGDARGGRGGGGVGGQLEPSRDFLWQRLSAQPEVGPPSNPLSRVCVCVHERVRACVRAIVRMCTCRARSCGEQMPVYQEIEVLAAYVDSVLGTWL